MTGRRDVAAQDVVAAWREVQPRPFMIPNEMTDLAIALDGLVSAYETEPAPVDWPARFRAAADEAERMGWDAAAHVFGALGVKAKFYPDEVEAIGRALLGETAETETTAELARRDGDTTHA